MTTVAQTLSTELLGRLAARVAVGIEALGDPLVRVPSLEDYDATRRVCESRDQDLAVDVDMGPFVLPLFGWLSNDGGERDDVDRLADDIVARVREASRGRVRHATVLGKARTMLEAKVARDGAGMRVLDLRPSRRSAHDTLVGCHLQMQADIELLDDALRPGRRRLVAWKVRDQVAEVNLLLRGQRIRQRTHARLARGGAILEVNRIAEDAIRSAGLGVGEVIAAMLEVGEGEQRGGVVPSRSLQTREGEMIVYIRNGLVEAGCTLPNFGALQGGRLVIDRDLPHTVAASLIGRPATDLIDHPVLRGTARVTGVDQSNPGQTFLALKIRKRPLTAAELDYPAMRKAA